MDQEDYEDTDPGTSSKRVRSQSARAQSESKRQKTAPTDTPSEPGDTDDVPKAELQPVNILSVAPLHSGAELSKLVRALNSEIELAAARITEIAQPKKLKPTGCPKATIFIGSTMMKRVRDEDKNNNGRAYLQKALEGVMVVACYNMLEMYTADEQKSKIFAEVNESIKRESASLAGLWRAATKKHTKIPAYETVRKDLAEKIDNLVIQTLEISKKSRSKVKIQQEIQDVCQAALKLDKALSEDPTGNLWDVFYARPKTPYDTNMVEPSRFDKVPAAACKILCPTNLGLRLTLPGSGVQQQKTVLKAKALLEEDNDHAYRRKSQRGGRHRQIS